MAHEPDDQLPEDEVKRRTEAAIRASFELPPKTHKEMVGESGRPPRKVPSKALKDRKDQP